SLGEVDQMLRQWLGHEVRVSGELSHVAAGPDKGALALSIRVGDEPGVRFVQADGDLEPLLQQAAEVVYRSRRPESYATWLDQHGRHEDAVATLRSLTGVGSRADRAEALSQLAQMLNTSATIYERLDLQRRALQLTPGAGAAMVNLAGTEVNAGHSEAGLKQYVAQLKSPPPPGSNDEGVAMWPQLGAQGRGDLLGDYGPSIAFGCFLYGVKPCSIAGLVAASSANPGGVHPALTPQGRLSVIAVDVARSHAVGAADKLANQPRNWPATMAADLLDLRKGQWIAAATEADRQREDWTALLARSPAYEALIGPYPGVPAFTAGRLNFMLALAKTGNGPEALARIGATPPDCYPCLITRGQIAATLGDRQGAEKWFAEAARQGPSLPQADLEWGRVLLAAGQADAAITHLQTAARRGPKFADPLEVWGEALLAKSDAAGAVKKFAAADKLTPWWGRLHLKWGQALAKLGKADEARAQLKAAAGLDLTANERAELGRVKL
ncbi:MAG TPA: hypothetical protein VFN88_11695, partial [Caulobacteraceae bacterium]|nr:hypothetical protein [Caulobacteraceae bacterium]